MGAVAYLVVANPSSKNNLGTLIRCAAAFGVEEVVVVGASKWSTHGAHGSHKHVKYRWFGEWESAATFLKLERGCDLCGIVQPSISTRPASSASPSSATAATAPAAVTPTDTATASTATCVPPEAGEGKVGFDPKSQAEGMTIGHVGKIHNNQGRSEETFGEDQERSEKGSRDYQELSEKRSAEDEERSEKDYGEYQERSEKRSDETTERRKGGADTSGCDCHDSSERLSGARVSSVAVRDRPFRRSTAFLVGHRNRLEAKALDVCDFLVHVEQATDFAMDLGPPVTTSIVLHHFTAWANYEERRFEGEKFDVEKDTGRCRPPVNEEKGLAEERMRKREKLRAADPLEAGGGDGHGDGDGDDEAGGGAGGGLQWLSGVGDEDVEEEADY